MTQIFKVLLVLLFIVNVALGQNQQLDSLQKVLKEDKVHLIADIHRIVDNHFCNFPETSNALISYSQQLSLKFKKRSDYSHSLFMRAKIMYCINAKDRAIIDTLNKAIKLSEPISNYNTLCESYLLIGNVYQNLYEFNASLTCLRKAVHYGEFVNNQTLRGIALHEVGELYLHRSNHDKALKYLYESANFLKTQENSVPLAMVFNSLGLVMSELNKNEEALSFFLKAINTTEKSKHKSHLGIIYNNLGQLYSKRYDFDASTKCYRKGLELNQEYENFVAMAYSFNYLGNDLFAQGKYDKAISYYNEALRYNINKDREVWAEVYMNIGKVHARRGASEKGIRYYKKALKHAKSIETRTIELDLYKLMYEAYERNDDISISLDYLKLFTKLKDSILNIETSFKISELKAAYESDQKESTIKLLTKENEIESNKNEKQKQIIIYGILLVLFFIVLSYLFFRQTQQNKKKQLIIEAQTNKIMNSINYAKKIQDAILTPIDFIRNYLPDSFILYKPKDIVSGDFYWFSHIEDLEIIVAADCTGHGVPGAFMSMIGATLLNKIVNERKITEPCEILNQLNQEVLIALQQKEKNSQSKEGMDITLCAINKEKKTIHYAGAMNSLYLVKNGEVITYKPNLRSIGGMTKKINNEEFKFKQETIHFESGTHIYLISDGYVDQFGGEKHKKYNTKKFKELLSRIHSCNIHEQRTEIEQEFNTWKKDLKQIDDVLVIGIKLESVN